MRLDNRSRARTEIPRIHPALPSRPARSLPPPSSTSNRPNGHRFKQRNAFRSKRTCLARSSAKSPGFSATESPDARERPPFPSKAHRREFCEIFCANGRTPCRRARRRERAQLRFVSSARKRAQSPRVQVASHNCAPEPRSRCKQSCFFRPAPRKDRAPNLRVARQQRRNSLRRLVEQNNFAALKRLRVRWAAPESEIASRSNRPAALQGRRLKRLNNIASPRGIEHRRGNPRRTIIASSSATVCSAPKRPSQRSTSQVGCRCKMPSRSAGAKSLGTSASIATPRAASSAARRSTAFTSPSPTSSARVSPTQPIHSPPPAPVPAQEIAIDKVRAAAKSNFGSSRSTGVELRRL